MSEHIARPRHRRFRIFYTAVAAGIGVFLVAYYLAATMALALGSIAFFLVYLVVSFWELPRFTAKFLKAHAVEADVPVMAIFGVTLIVIAVAVFSLFVVINNHQSGNGVHLVITAAAVILGWFMVHAMAAHHYAYEYYDVPDIDADVQPSGSVVGGLNFPTGPEPDGISFIYFSYVIGMTAQVADVAVASVHMQRLVVIHGIFSFFFNAVIIAATVNLAVSLGY